MAETKTYRLTQLHYRSGVMYQPGELITVPADEKPGKTWQLVEAKPVVQHVDVPTPAKKPATPKV